MKTTQEGVLIVSDEDGNAVAIVRKDDATHHNLFYLCQLAGFEDIERLLNHKK